MKPGIHPDVPASSYHAAGIAEKPALSASIAKILVGRSPRHAWHAHPRLNPNWKPDERKTFDIGSAAHLLFLEGERFAERVASLDFADWRSKAAQAARDAARAEGRIPLLADQWARIVEMVEAVHEQVPGLEMDPPMFVGGKPEQTLIWREGETVCKARLDYLHDTFLTADDFKTVTTERGSAKPDVWERVFWHTGCDIEAVFHSRGVYALTGKWPEFRLLVAESTPPFGISVVTLHESALEIAKAKVDYAIETWAKCMASGVWPSYPPRAVAVEANWRQHEEARLLEEAA